MSQMKIKSQFKSKSKLDSIRLKTESDLLQIDKIHKDLYKYFKLLEQSSDQEQQNSTKLLELTQQNLHLQAENKNLQQENQQLHSAIDKQLHQINSLVKQLTTELEQKIELASIKEQNQNLLGQREQLERKINFLEFENQRLSLQNQQLKKCLDQSQQNYKKIQEEILENMKKLLDNNSSATKIYQQEIKLNEKSIMIEDLKIEIQRLAQDYESKLKDKELEYEMLKAGLNRNLLLGQEIEKRKMRLDQLTKSQQKKYLTKDFNMQSIFIQNENDFLELKTHEKKLKEHKNQDELEFINESSQKLEFLQQNNETDNDQCTHPEDFHGNYSNKRRFATKKLKDNKKIKKNDNKEFFLLNRNAINLELFVKNP